MPLNENSENWVDEKHVWSTEDLHRLASLWQDASTTHPRLRRLSPRALRHCGSCLTGFGSSPPPKRPATR